MGMWLRLLPASLLAAAVLPAQPTRLVDEAAFTFTRAGAPYGTEVFRIVSRAGRDGPEFVTQGTRTIEGRVIRVALTTDTARTPSSYLRSVTGGTPSQTTARRGMNRLTVNEEGPQASSRDYPVRAGSVLLDEDVIHTLHFVTWQPSGECYFVDITGRTSGVSKVNQLGLETLMIGTAAVPAVRYELGTGDTKREVWVDSEGRLLKVAHPARQVVGVRDHPPR